WVAAPVASSSWRPVVAAKRGGEVRHNSRDVLIRRRGRRRSGRLASRRARRTAVQSFGSTEGAFDGDEAEGEDADRTMRLLVLRRCDTPVARTGPAPALRPLRAGPRPSLCAVWVPLGAQTAHKRVREARAGGPR